jgi:hypothetical protein
MAFVYGTTCANEVCTGGTKTTFTKVLNSSMGGFVTSLTAQALAIVFLTF